MPLSSSTKRDLAIAMADNPSANELSALIESVELTANRAIALAQIGSNLLADGALLHGTYPGTIVVDGSATLTADVIVKGDLIVLNNLNNQGRFGLTVYGNLTVVNQFLFSPNEIGAQSNVTIYGDFVCAYGEMIVNSGTSAPTLFVGGDMTILNNNDFHGQGQDGASGLNVYINGDLIIDYFSLAGGQATASLAAGNGGNLTVQGSAYFYDGIDLDGGYSGYDNQDAGNGGYLEVHHNVAGYFNLSGGSTGSNAANAGNGGGFNCYGNAVIYWSSASGGSCSSTNPSKRAGVGGYYYVAGNITGDGYVSGNGGDRTGSIVGSDNVASPNAGYIYSYGDVKSNELYFAGGQNSTDNGSGGSNGLGGDGGYIYVFGSITCQTIDVSGGNASFAPGGNAGTFECDGNITFSGNLSANGGSSSDRNGNLGQFIFLGGATGDTVQMLDGNGSGSAPGNQRGIYFGGSLMVRVLNVSDRTTAQIMGRGSFGATLQVESMLSKKVLTKPDNSDTIDISAMLQDSIYRYSQTSGWFRIQGTGV